MTSLPPNSVQTILVITGARIFERLKLVRIMRTHVIIEQIPISRSLDLIRISDACKPTHVQLIFLLKPDIIEQIHIADSTQGY